MGLIEFFVVFLIRRIYVVEKDRGKSVEHRGYVWHLRGREKGGELGLWPRSLHLPCTALHYSTLHVKCKARQCA